MQFWDDVYSAIVAAVAVGVALISLAVVSQIRAVT
jgi:hypothetical protein